MALCFIESELLSIEVSHCGIGIFDFYCPVTFSLTFIYELWPVFPGDIPYMQIWTSYVKAFESYRLTDRQTDKQTDRQRVRHYWNYIARRFAVRGQKSPWHSRVTNVCFVFDRRLLNFCLVPCFNLERPSTWTRVTKAEFLLVNRWHQCSQLLTAGAMRKLLSGPSGGQSEVASSWSASVSSDFMALYKCCYY